MTSTLAAAQYASFTVDLHGGVACIGLAQAKRGNPFDGAFTADLVTGTRRSSATSSSS